MWSRELGKLVWDPGNIHACKSLSDVGVIICKVLSDYTSVHFTMLIINLEALLLGSVLL